MESRKNKNNGNLPLIPNCHKCQLLATYKEWIEDHKKSKDEFRHLAKEMAKLVEFYQDGADVTTNMFEFNWN